MDKKISLNEGISVIVPIYNSEKTLATCLNSILNQTYNKLQVICINDGSTDNSKKILEHYAKYDNRILIIEQNNSGGGKARNIGISFAQYPYITFVDSDDFLELSMYENMLHIAKKFKVDCVCCDALVHQVSGNIHTLKTVYDEKMYNKSDIENIIASLIGFNSFDTSGMCSLCNKLFLTQIIKDNNLMVPENRSHGEDWMFCIEYFRHISSIFFIHRPFYHYIHHSNNSLVTKYRDNYFELAIADRKQFIEWFPHMNWCSDKKIHEWKFLPINSMLYYRKHLNAKHLKKKVFSIYNVCKYEKFYDKIDSRKIFCDLFEALDKENFDKFYKLLLRATNIDFYTYKLKIIIKKIMHM